MALVDDLLLEAEAELGHQADGLGELLPRLVESGLAFLETETGLRWREPVAEERYLSGGNGSKRFLWIPEVDFTLEEVAVQYAPGQEFQILEAEDWSLVGSHTVTRTNGVPWPAGRRNIRLMLSAGATAATDIPGDLLMVFRHFVAAAYRGKRSVTPTALPDEGEVRRGLSPLDWRILKQYRAVPQGF